MLKFLADENFTEQVVTGAFQREPALDLIRARDVSLVGVSDSAVLQWAADEERILLTHDVSTVRPCAEQRVLAGLAMPGVLLVHRLTVVQAIDAILTLAYCGVADDCKDQVRYLPWW